MRRLNSRELSKFIANQLTNSNIFAARSLYGLDIRAQITNLTQESSIGAAAERRSVMSSGAVLTARMTIRYDLYDGDNIIGSWTVQSSAQSNSLAAATRIAESFDIAAKRNVRALILTIVRDHNPSEAKRAGLALAQLDSEVDSTRTAFGYLMFGAARTTGAVGSAVGAIAQNGHAIAAGLNEAAASSRAITSIAQHPLGRPTYKHDLDAETSEDATGEAVKAKSRRAPQKGVLAEQRNMKPSEKLLKKDRKSPTSLLDNRLTRQEKTRSSSLTLTSTGATAESQANASQTENVLPVSTEQKNSQKQNTVKGTAKVGSLSRGDKKAREFRLPLGFISFILGVF
ncbi:MAG: hypothetical protein EON58_12380 [Alphaproteobacteria bacterium]|nr:MAG: hypothetical protein EON58_12380 [Alphaproteobacteria bacterium]